MIDYAIRTAKKKFEILQESPSSGDAWKKGVLFFEASIERIRRAEAYDK